MTHRKIGEGAMEVSEDAFGTPPAARGGMMKVAGASDDDLEPGEDLLVDEGDPQPDEYKGNDAVGAPFYPEGVVRISVGDLRRMVTEVIKKTGGKYTLYTKHKKGGKRRKLGTHSTKKVAIDQEKAIHAHGG